MSSVATALRGMPPLPAWWGLRRRARWRSPLLLILHQGAEESIDGHAHAVFHLNHGKLRILVQQFRHQTVVFRIEVLHHDKSGAGVLGDGAEEPGQSLQSAS
jgi:hypothetical protein